MNEEIEKLPEIENKILELLKEKNIEVPNIEVQRCEKTPTFCVKPIFKYLYNMIIYNLEGICGYTILKQHSLETGNGYSSDEIAEIFSNWLINNENNK